MNETIGIIPRAFRRRGVWVACTLLLRAGLNFLGLAMLLPVLALVLDPGSLEGGGVLTRAYEGLGFASQRTFALAVCAAVVGVIVLKCLLGLWLARVERTYIYDLYRTLSRRLLVTYHDRGCRSSRRRTRPYWPATSTSSAWPSRRACSNPPPPSPPRRCCSCCCSGR